MAHLTTLTCLWSITTTYELTTLMSFLALVIMLLKSLGSSYSVLIRFPAAIFAPFNGTPTWRLHTKPYKFGLLDRPGSWRGFCIFNFSHFPDSGLSVLTAWLSCIFIFDGVTVKTQKSDLQREGGGGGMGVFL